MKTAAPKTKIYRKVWKPIFLVQIYRLTRMGMSEADIARTLKVNRTTLYRWMAVRPEVKEAVALARKERAEGFNFKNWIYSQLRPELQTLWDEVEKFSNEPNGVLRIEQLLQDQGKGVRQELFLHALCVENFSPSNALAKVNVSKSEFDRWLVEEPDFAQLVAEIDWHKGNFFEEKLVRLVDELNPSAVIFANKNFNSKRGYADRKSVDVNVSGSIVQGSVDLSSLIPFLEEKTQIELLEAIRRWEEATQTKAKPQSAQELVTQQIVATAGE